MSSLDKMVINKPKLKINKLAAIDGSYFLHRSLRVPEIYELQYEGIRTGGVLQFLRSITMELNKLGAYPVVVFDGGLSPRRLEAFPNYKRTEDRAKDAKRYEEDQSSMTDQEIEEYEGSLEYLDTYRFSRNMLIKILRYISIPVLYLGGVEGDDLLSALSRSDISNETTILTEDRDMIQLVTPDTKIIRPIQGQVVTYDDLLKEYDSPRHFMEVKAIVGDGSDNVPQLCKGVGHAKALVLAREYLANGYQGVSDYLAANMRYKWVQKFSATDYKTQWDINRELVDLLRDPDELISTNPSIMTIIESTIRESVSNSPQPMLAQSALAEYKINEVDMNELVSIAQLGKFHVDN